MCMAELICVFVCVSIFYARVIVHHQSFKMKLTEMDILVTSIPIFKPHLDWSKNNRTVLRRVCLTSQNS